MNKVPLFVMIVAVMLLSSASIRKEAKIKQNMNKPINSSAPVISSSQIVINAPVEKVWSTLTDISNWPNWQKAVTEVRILGGIEEGTRFKWKAGSFSFKSQLHTVSPFNFFGWTGKTIGASAIHNWSFSQQGDSTLVRVEESLEGFFPVLLKKSFQRNLDNGMVENLKELKAATETN